jgi:hypothetical protein
MATEPEHVAVRKLACDGHRMAVADAQKKANGK